MVKQSMFDKIKLLQRQGYSIIEISAKLSLNRKTVSKYFHMPENDYKKYLLKMSYKEKVFEIYKRDIMFIYSANDNIKLIMAAVYDFLEEKYGELPYTEKTLRNYINYLINTAQISLNKNVRMYQKVPQLPYGQQTQLDFGVYKTKNNLKLYIFAAVLSASRFKYIAFQKTPFKTNDVILHILDSFDFFQGRPQELVIDQDRTMVVSENHGDIIFTNDFQYFLEEMELRMYVCRKSDPESKGKIENVIKYVKYNYLQPRTFSNIEKAQKGVISWLNRRGNGKIHQTTKKIPLNEIVKERKYLKSPVNSIYRKDLLVGREERVVNEHSFISVNASQYSVPNQYRNKKVEIFITKHKLYIFDRITAKEITIHNLSLVYGEKNTNKEHFREKQKTAGELKTKVLDLFQNEKWRIFMKQNFKKYSRYTRDQCLEVIKHFGNKGIDPEIFNYCLDYCLKNKTYSISNLKDTYRHFSLLNHHESQNDSKGILKTKIIERIEVKKRNLDLYKKIIRGDVNEIL